MTEQTPAEQLATLLAMVRDDTGRHIAGHEEPPERWLSEADCDYFAARQERIEQRWREGGAA